MKHGTLNAYTNFGCRCDRCRDHWAERARKRRPYRKAQPTFVYFIQAGDGPVKIGVASDVQRRLRALRTASPEELHLCGYVPGEYALEGRLHSELDAHRIRGEWFAPGPALQALKREYSMIEERAAERERSLATGTHCRVCQVEVGRGGMCEVCVELAEAREGDVDPFDAVA